MRAMVFLIPVACLLLAGCGRNEKKPVSQTTNNTTKTGGNPITAPVDYLGAVGRAKQSATRSLDLSYLTQAIQLFQGTEDRLPTDLNELVQKGYIARLPTPAPGTKLLYDPRTGAVRIARQ